VKRSDNILAYLFVIVLTLMIWLWAAANTKIDTNVEIILRFSPPGGSSSTVTPSETTVAVTFHGPEAGLKAARLACSDGLTLTVPTTSGTPEIDLSSRIAQLDSIRKTGVEITEIEPKTISLHVKTMVSVEAVVVPVLNNVQISGDVTVDPATVTLLIPSSVRDTLPEAIKVTATLSPNELSLLQHGVVHTKNTGVRLPSPLDLSDVTVEPKTVSISFKIQSNTAKTVISQVRVLLAGPAEDYSDYSIELPKKIIPNVTVEADAELIALIENGNATVFAIVRLASRELELGIKQKNVTTFLAIAEDGTGHEIKATVEEQSLLGVELIIKPIPIPTPTPVTTE
jgi:hypothetical protein